MKKLSKPAPIPFTRKDGESCELQKVELIPIKSFVRRKEGKEVFTRGEYCRFSKKYELHSEYDTSRCIYVKKGTLLETEFNY